MSLLLGLFLTEKIMLPWLWTIGVVWKARKASARGMTPMACAALSGDANMVSQLCDAQLDVDRRGATRVKFGVVFF